MKNLSQFFLILGIICSGFLAKANSSDIPKNARLFGQVTGLAYTRHKAGVATEGDSKIIEFEKANQEYLSTNCSEIIYQWSTVKRCYTTGPCILGDLTSFFISIYCVPRPESQKFIMSVELTCEKNPTVECVKLAPQFDQIAPTTSRNIGRPN